MTDVTADPAPTAGRGPAPDDRGGEILAQRLLAPDAAVNPEPALFFRSRDAAGWSAADGAYVLAQGATLTFDAWFNVFDAGAYDLGPEDRIVLRLRGRGDLLAALRREPAGIDPPGGPPAPRSIDWLGSCRLEAPEGEREVEIEVPPPAEGGLLFLSLEALAASTLSAADWWIRAPRRNAVRIEAVITTFRRDAAVQATARRLGAYMAGNPDVGAHFGLTVVDNGGETERTPFGRVITNRNLGGAGGFTRGLLEAKATPGVTHVLFLDDDATFFPENLRRTLAALQLSREPRRVVPGAMLSEGRRWELWENTAVFDRVCRPLDHRLDLRDPKALTAAARPRPGIENRYGGWWYFCFPLAHAEVLPFPFFVRGDDVWFSLANDFALRPIIGVSSQQEDFTVKRTPLTAYLDSRYHVIQQLAHETLDPAFGAIRGQLEFLFHGWNLTCHYASAEAVCLAIEDVCEGPDFWDRDPELAGRRADLKRIGEAEIPKPGLRYPLDGVAAVAADRHTRPLHQWLRRVSGNGHRLPDRMFYSRAGIFPLSARATPNQTFLRRELVFVDDNTGEGYRLHLSRARYAANVARFRAALARLERALPELRAAYRGARPELVSEPAWRRRLGLAD